MWDNAKLMMMYKMTTRPAILYKDKNIYVTRQSICGLDVAAKMVVSSNKKGGVRNS